jgi:hypothetical protein
MGQSQDTRGSQGNSDPIEAVPDTIQQSVVTVSAGKIPPCQGKLLIGEFQERSLFLFAVRRALRKRRKFCHLRDLRRSGGVEHHGAGYVV